MALIDKAVLTASTGFVFQGPVGLARPTPAQVTAMDPATFGAQSWTLTPASSGVYTLSAGGDDTDDLPAASPAGAIQNALEQLEEVGIGNVLVEDVTGGKFTVTLVGELQGKTLPLTVTGTGASITVATAPNGWQITGHTSRDEMPEFGFDGGDTEIRGTWQNARLREQETETPSDYLILNVAQFDRTGFEMYYGPSSTNTPGVFGVSGNKVTNEKSTFVLIRDGGISLGFYAPKASLRREDAISLTTDEFSYMPVRMTFLKYGNSDLYQWVSEDLL